MHTDGLEVPRPLPQIAERLGYAGLLPQGAALLLIALGSPVYHFTALALAFAYAALIFSFLGALWWGLAAAQVERAPGWVWPVGVLPSLVALLACMPWANGSEWPGPSLLMLAGGIGVSALVDWRLHRLGLCPPGWLRLRVKLSLGLGVLTAGCALV